MGMPTSYDKILIHLLTVNLWTVWMGLTRNPCVLGTPGNPIRCTISGASGSPGADITCLFGKDLRQPKSAFSVVHYRFDAANDVPGTDVVVCISRQTSDRPECAVRDGYSMHFDLTENATITISKVTTATEGRYACHLVPLEDRTTHLCEVNATEFLQNVPKLSSQDYTEATVNKTQHNNRPTVMTRTVAEEPTSNVGGLVAGVVVACIVSAVVVGLLLVYCRRKKLAKSKERNEKNPDRSTETPLNPQSEDPTESPARAAAGTSFDLPESSNLLNHRVHGSGLSVTNASDDQKRTGPQIDPQKDSNSTNALLSSAHDYQKTIGLRVQQHKGSGNANALLSSVHDDDQKAIGLQLQLLHKGPDNTNSLTSFPPYSDSTQIRRPLSSSVADISELSPFHLKDRKPLSASTRAHLYFNSLNDEKISTRENNGRDTLHDRTKPKDLVAEERDSQRVLPSSASHYLHGRRNENGVEVAANDANNDEYSKSIHLLKKKVNDLYIGNKKP